MPGIGAAPAGQPGALTPAGQPGALTPAGGQVGRRTAEAYHRRMSVIDGSSPAATRLRDAPLAWLTTVRPDGQPQSSYVWFHFDGDDLVVRSQPGAGKVRNIRANPKVSFHLDGDRTMGGDVVTIDATAEILDGELEPGRADAYVAKYGDAIRDILRETPEQLQATYSTTLRLTPRRVRAW